MEAADLSLRPPRRPEEAVENIPGVIVTQHSGSGKASLYSLRGFNLDHAADLAIGVDGIPVNMPSGAHGQERADLNFRIEAHVCLNAVTVNGISEATAAALVESHIWWTGWFRTVAGLRADACWLDVRNIAGGTSGHAQSILPSPKLDLRSALVWDGDAGGSTPSGPTRRYDAEIANFYLPVRRLTVDADHAWSYARLPDYEAGETFVPEALVATPDGDDGMDVS